MSSDKLSIKSSCDRLLRDAENQVTRPIKNVKYVKEITAVFWRVSGAVYMVTDKLVVNMQDFPNHVQEMSLDSQVQPHHIEFENGSDKVFVTYRKDWIPRFHLMGMEGGAEALQKFENEARADLDNTSNMRTTSAWRSVVYGDYGVWLVYRDHNMETTRLDKLTSGKLDPHGQTWRRRRSPLDYALRQRSPESSYHKMRVIPIYRIESPIFRRVVDFKKETDQKCDEGAGGDQTPPWHKLEAQNEDGGCRSASSTVFSE